MVAPMVVSAQASPYPRHNRRPRLAPECYIGHRQAFLTICVADRDIDLTAGHTPTHLAFLMGETAGRTGHLLHAWVIMPDHVHVLAEGRSHTGDIREWVRLFKHRSSMGYRRRTGRHPLWQRSFYDRILRSEEPRERVCQYILDNPQRKALCNDWRKWPWSGGHVHEMLMRDGREGNS